MKSFIKKIVREALSGVMLLESSELKFPEDYHEMSSRAQYMYSMGAMRPIGNNDDWYESKIIEKKYRGIPVKMKHILNKDKSERGWKIVSVGFKGDYIKQDHNTPNSENVRKVIDKYYSDFEEYMNNIEADDNELENQVSNLEKKIGRKLNKPIEDTPIENAIRWLIGNAFTLVEKRKILKYLMNNGLSTEDAIGFWKNVK